MAKSITELSEQELLSILGADSQAKVYTWPNDVMEFISVYNLKSGTEEVTSSLLYNLYTHWSKDPVKRKAFTFTLRDLFPTINYSKTFVVLLNSSTLNLKAQAYKYVEKEDKTKEKGWMDHFEKYLFFYSLKSGSFFAKDSVLYSLYSRWYGKKRRPLGFKQFNNHCKLYFKNKLIKTHYWFAVDHSIKNHLDEELIKDMDSASQKKNKKIRI
jgi:hypothetical protein